MQAVPAVAGRAWWLQVSTMAYHAGLVAAGGFNGELVCYSMEGDGRLLYAERVTNK